MKLARASRRLGALVLVGAPVGCSVADVYVTRSTAGADASQDPTSTTQGTGGLGTSGTAPDAETPGANASDADIPGIDIPDTEALGADAGRRDPNGALPEAAICEPGTYVKKAPSSTEERICTPCASGSYTDRANQPICIPQELCPAGKVQVSGGTTTSPIVCETCEPGSYCAGGAAPQKACSAGTWDDDRSSATACVPWSSCLAGTFVSNTPSSTEDRVCQPCQDGTRSDQPNQSHCVPIGACAAGTEQTAPGTSTSPPVCKTCEAGTYCAGGTALKKPCENETWDHDRSPATICVPWTSCAPGTYVTQEPSAVADRACTQCSEQSFSTIPNSKTCTAYFLWTSQHASSGTDTAESISVDGNGNIYVAGETTGVFPGCTDAAAEDAFLLKFDASGILVWADQFGSTGIDYGYGVKADEAGNAYVVGAANGKMPGATAIGQRDGYLRKYDQTGAVQWTHQFGTSGWDGATAVDVDPSGNVYMTGVIDGKATAPGATVTDGRVYVRQFCSTGDPQWMDTFAPEPLGPNVWPTALGVDKNGNVYIVGQSSGSIAGQPIEGNLDVFVRKQSAARTASWTRMFGSSKADYGQSLAIDGEGNVVVVGTVQTALPGQTYAGDSDAFVRKYSADGNELWTRQFGTAASDYAESVSIDAAGNIYVAGLDLLRKYGSDGTLLWSHGLNGVFARAVIAVRGRVYVAGTMAGHVFLASVVP